MMASETFGEYETLLGQPDSMSTGERIRDKRKGLGLSQAALAIKTGVSRPAVTQWENNQTVPDRERLRKLSEVLGVSESWLLEGVEDMARQGGQLMPVRGEVAAGVWREAVSDLELSPIPVSAHPDFPASSQYALLVRGDSINKIAADGDYLHVVDVQSAGVSIRDGDLVIVLKHQHGLTEATAKRLVAKNGTRQLVAESTNPQFSGVIPLSPADAATEIVISAKVIGKYTSFFPPRP